MEIKVEGNTVNAYNDKGELIGSLPYFPDEPVMPIKKKIKKEKPMSFGFGI